MLSTHPLLRLQQIGQSSRQGVVAQLLSFLRGGVARFSSCVMRLVLSWVLLIAAVQEQRHVLNGTFSWAYLLVPCCYRGLLRV